jgi:hypothetical protein
MRTILLSLWCVGLAACGGTPFQNFVGTWVYQMGSAVQAQCPNPIGNVTTDLRGNARIVHALDGDLSFLDVNGCDVLYTVKDPTATATGNLSCTHPVAGQNQATQSDTITMATLTTSDGKTLTYTSSGNAMITSAVGSTTCTFTVNATLKKIAND